MKAFKGQQLDEGPIFSRPILQKDTIARVVT